MDSSDFKFQLLKFLHLLLLSPCDILVCWHSFVSKGPPVSVFMHKGNICPTVLQLPVCEDISYHIQGHPHLTHSLQLARVDVHTISWNTPSCAFSKPPSAPEVPPCHGASYTSVNMFLANKSWQYALLCQWSLHTTYTMVHDSDILNN